MKLIDRLFLKFGYVPKRHHNKVLKVKNDIEADYMKLVDEKQNNIFSVMHQQTKAWYYWTKTKENIYRFVVYLDNKDNRVGFVKAIITDDFHYGKVCAEELVELINEKN